MNFIKKVIKSILWILHADITKNQKYDRLTYNIMKKVIKPGSNCIDIGCHKGEMLDLMLKFSPQGMHYAFEPIPEMFHALVEKYSKTNCRIFKIGLSDSKGEADFHYVVNAPAYSGFRKRRYAVKKVEISKIIVKKDRLDNILPKDLKISFVKIDVEGAELEVLKGGIETIRRCRPVIIFEHGLGASDHYGTTPEDIYNLFTNGCNMKVSLMDRWLNNQDSLTKQEFSEQFGKGINYYFIAY
ncbi:MAG: FkbM family methyltransferase [Bacteroidia bacterium]|nr:FkbM family methyltransferase [Bacteroidia bacterium]